MGGRPVAKQTLLKSASRDSRFAFKIVKNFIHRAPQAILGLGQPAANARNTVNVPGDFLVCTRVHDNRFSLAVDCQHERPACILNAFQQIRRIAFERCDGVNISHVLLCYILAVASIPGSRLACVVCSKPYAILSSVGSLHGTPKNEMPAGRPCTNPAGTVMCGYPATAGGVEQPPFALSPLIQSVSQARHDVGATSASRRCLAKAASMPSVRVRRKHSARAFK